MRTIFDYRRCDAVALKSTDELMDQFTSRVEWMLDTMRSGHEHAAKLLALSVYRQARELEHRGIRIRNWQIWNNATKSD